MAVDRSYGSGRSVSAANSAARRTRSSSATLRKKNIQKVASKPFQKAAVRSVGKTAAAGFNIGGRQYLETGVSTNKLAQAASSLLKAGKFSVAEAVESRLFAKRLGSARSSNLSGRSGKTPVSNLSPRLLDSAQRVRNQSESVFPRASKSAQASQRLQKVADTITKRHYADVAKKGIGHGDAVNMPRAQVLRNLKAKRGIQINRPGGR